jgi:hypothetical protein
MLHINRKEIQVTIWQRVVMMNLGNTISLISKFRRMLVTQKYSIDMMHT